MCLPEDLPVKGAILSALASAFSTVSAIANAAGASDVVIAIPFLVAVVLLSIAVVMLVLDRFW
ncbi:hypothetical protein IQ03_04518 [Gemmobacter caeni]|uniref:Uncharacterized protein n=1 Tax=Gemmobacter caeni TaxID=589035 RepID=A0A2T6APA3_9RHOB|nr:hypothetical protein [Gemmobacter caeni]PTX45610.1 hypothetical protein C8N34_12140 [Gemmobacter caeni]TWI93757.1 hypothetical protein IQ03_04518 [Gemmobacter caeni]